MDAADPDQVQDLFNKFLTANSDFGRPGGGGKPNHLDINIPAQHSLLGAFGITTPVVGVIAAAVEKNDTNDPPAESELLEQQYAGDSSLAFSAVPSSLYSLRGLLAGREDVNTPQYWDTFADGECHLR